MCDKKTSQETNSKSLSYWWLLGLAVVVICIQLGLWYWMISILGTAEDPWTARGQFGDMFGAVNTLFSGLAFAGVIFAIILQSRELTLQREELGLSRTVNQAAAEAQAEQADLLDRASKIKVIEKEIDIEIALMNLDFGNARAIGHIERRQKTLDVLSQALPVIRKRYIKYLLKMKELAGMEPEPPEPPTPQP